MSPAETRFPRPDTTILLIEDDPSLRDIISNALKKNGYRVLVARDTAQATDLWNANRAAVHLMIADVVTPGISGPELARELRSENPKLKIIFISGEPQEPAQATRKLVKDAKFLAKPFSLEDILAMVREELGDR